MIPEYIRKDKNYPIYSLAENSLIELINKDTRLKNLVDRIISFSDKNNKLVKKEVQHYLAWNLFFDCEGDVDRLLSIPNLSNRLYNDLVMLKE